MSSLPRFQSACALLLLVCAASRADASSLSACGCECTCSGVFCFAVKDKIPSCSTFASYNGQSCSALEPAINEQAKQASVSVSNCKGTVVSNRRTLLAVDKIAANDSGSNDSNASGATADDTTMPAANTADPATAEDLKKTNAWNSKEAEFSAAPAASEWLSADDYKTMPGTEQNPAAVKADDKKAGPKRHLRGVDLKRRLFCGQNGNPRCV